MKITCDREPFLAAFQTASAVAPSRSPKPILRNVKMEASADVVTLIATDLEVGIRVNVPGVAVEVPGAAILPVDRMGSILRESSDERLSIEITDNATFVKGDRSEFHFPLQNPDEFPDVAEFAEEKYHSLTGKDLSQMIQRTVFATDNESTRYALGGVYWEMEGDKVIAVGTDGRRLAKMECSAQVTGGHTTADHNGKHSTIIPAKAMQMIARAIQDGEAEIKLSARGNDCLVQTPHATIYSRLVEGRFPTWRDVFPSNEGTNRVELVVGPTYSAVRQAAIVTDDDSRGIDFRFSEGQLTLTGRSQERGDSKIELPVPYEGPELPIKLDPRYVSDFLKVLDAGQSFTMQLTDSDHPALCTTEDGYAYVIMPLAREEG